jgi:uncharacterized OB-fold protein
MPLRTVPVLHDLNREFWTAGSDNELRLPRCAACGFWSYPPGPMCPRCRRRTLRWETTSGTAVLFTYTHNCKAWNPEVPVPYTIGIVELPEQSGLRMTSNIVHCDPADVFIGMPLRVVFERQDEFCIPLFEPDSTAPAGKNAAPG